jgi:uncharacterized protein (DUF362 family)
MSTWALAHASAAMENERMTKKSDLREPKTCDAKASKLSRRVFLGTAAAAGAAVVATGAAKRAMANPSLAAAPPSGFTPLNAPGKIVKVTKAGSLQPNGLYPKEDDAKEMLERALKELTGAATLAASLGKFIHKDDKVAVKVNGIAKGGKFGTNKELVLPLLQGLLDLGVPASSIVVYEQFNSHMLGTRISQSNVPAGITCATHLNKDMATDDQPFPDMGGNIQTKFCRQLMEATAVIDVTLIKDHSICGYTGCLKNMTHGSINNPGKHHLHHASPQIANLYAHEAIKSRVRLHVIDGYKIMYDGGPVEVVSYVPHESVYVTTDPVAMDALGWEMIDKIRADKKMKSLEGVGRKPEYIEEAGKLGLGVFDASKRVVKEITI